MELRHLRYFAAVAEELNFRKASERLRVAQPALSSQIKDLEYELGVRLLDRNTGGVRLTDAGTAFLVEVRQLLARAEQAMVVAREAAKGRRGRLTIGYFAAIFMGLMPGSLKAFREKYPDVDVELVEMPISEQLVALEAGTIHIGFMVAGGLPVPPSLSAAEVARSPIRVVMARGHRLARAKQISMDQLLNEHLLCFSAKRGAASVHREIMSRTLESYGVKVKAIQQIDGADAFSATLASGLGISLVAESGTLTQNHDIVTRPLKDTGPDFSLGLLALWRKDQESQLVANFVAVMKRVAPVGGTGKSAKR
ncbi:MAG: LysR substrate-binding domain-containing protein [Nibricoccus sp.]